MEFVAGGGSTRSVLGGRLVVDLSERAVLGQGSFAVVRKAMLDHRTSCACKEYLNADASREQFEAEIGILRRLSAGSPIVELIAASDPASGDEFAMALELGVCTLEEHVSAAQRPLVAEQVRSIALQCATALAHLEKLALVAVDFKPSNIMAFPNGAAEHCWKLIDADSFLATGTEVSAEDASVTPLYCPPEIARIFCEADATVKVPANAHSWNLGAVLLEVLAGGEAWLAKRYNVCRAVHGEDTDGVVKSFFSWLADQRAQVERSRDEAIARNGPTLLLSELLASLLAVAHGQRVSARSALRHGFLLSEAPQGHCHVLLTTLFRSKCWPTGRD